MRTITRLTIAIVWISIALGCHGAIGLSSAPGDTAISGRVDFGSGRSVQADFSQVADASTVSLMETTGATASTIATAVTRAGGAFTLTFPGYTPTPGKTYVLEAVKGLYGNAVNRDAARVRTLMQYNSGWLSVTNRVPNAGIVIGLSSTAVAAIYGLRPDVNPADLMGSVTVGQSESTPTPATLDTFLPPASPAGAITKQEFHTVSDLVNRALLGDSDPITAVQYDPVGNVFFVKTNSDPFIDNLSSTAAGYGAPLTITGYRFDAVPGNNTVYFGGATGSVATIDATRANTSNVLYVTVPEGAPSGPLLVRNQYGLSNGIQFTVLPRVGGKVQN